MEPSSDFNANLDCEKCGRCCNLNFIAVSDDELKRMHEYVIENDIDPSDNNAQRCCFQRPDHTCMIWPARPQVCRLHNCNKPRWRILEENPSIRIHNGLMIIDLHEEFVQK